MAYLLGATVGGFLVTTLFGLLFGRAFKSKEPFERAIIAALLGWVVCAVIAGFGKADGGPFRFDAGLAYIPGALGAFFLLQRRYEKASEMQQDDAAADG